MRTLKISVLLVAIGLALLTGCSIGIGVRTSGPPDLILNTILRPSDSGCYKSLLSFHGERVDLQMQTWVGTEIVKGEIIKALLQCGAVVDPANANYVFKAVVEYTGSSAIVNIYVTRTADGITCGSGSGSSEFYAGYYNDYRPFAFAARRALTSLRLNLPQ